MILKTRFASYGYDLSFGLRRKFSELIDLGFGFIVGREGFDITFDLSYLGQNFVVPLKMFKELSITNIMFSIILYFISALIFENFIIKPIDRKKN